MLVSFEFGAILRGLNDFDVRIGSAELIHQSLESRRPLGRCVRDIESVGHFAFGQSLSTQYDHLFTNRLA